MSFNHTRGFIFCITAFLPVLMFGNMGPQGFGQFKKRIFIETGTLSGDGIQKALDAGFEEVHSVDIDAGFIENSKDRFQGKTNIHLHLKDSSYQLVDVIKDIAEPAVFWLDAHNGFPDPNATGVKNTPLLEELDQIKNHSIKTHTILIDDLHCCGTLWFDFLTLDQIIAKVLEVNPEYTISFVNGGDEGE